MHTNNLVFQAALAAVVLLGITLVAVVAAAARAIP